MRKSKAEKTLIGWRESLALPELGVDLIKVKVDSGARTSALHAEDISFYRRGQKQYVKFTIYPEQGSTTKKILARAPLLGKRVVKSSIGVATRRPVISTLLKIDQQEFPIELTLVNRDVMGFRMLLGRQALQGRFIIDPSRSFLLGKQRKLKKKKAR